MLVMVTHPFGYHARPCLTLALCSCSVPLTLLWFLLNRSRITTVLTVLHQVMIYTIKRCDPGPPLITRRKLLLLMLHDRYIDRVQFIIFSDSLTVYRSIPLERFPYQLYFSSYSSSINDQWSIFQPFCPFGGSVQRRKKKVCAGWDGWLVQWWG